MSITSAKAGKRRNGEFKGVDAKRLYLAWKGNLHLHFNESKPYLLKMFNGSDKW